MVEALQLSTGEGFPTEERVALPSV